MKVNEFASNFQYENAVMTGGNFTNNLVQSGDSANLDSEAEVSVSNIYTDESNGKKLGRVKLELNGTFSVTDHPEANCTYHFVFNGEFSTPVDTPDKDFHKALWFNGSTALYGIARAKIETISSMIMQSGKISLPMVNMVELVKEQYKQKMQAAAEK